MAETQDPMAALDAADLPTRAAGARDLAAAGGPAAIPRLLQVAPGDKSPGVRLAAAGAAADILSRHRASPRFEAIPVEDRLAWLRVIAAVDPAVNTGLFAVCGTLGVPEAFTRVVIGLRDPRQDVRAGACVGLWRAVASAVCNGDDEVEARVVATLGDARIRIETRVEIARICADVGYGSALEAARALPGQCTRNTHELAEQLVTRLEASASPVGVWVDIGLDVGEVNARAAGDDVCVVLGVGDAIFAPLDGPPRREALPSAHRVLHARARDKETAGPVLQLGARTWWPAAPDDVCTFGDRLLAAGRPDLVDLAADALGASAAALRVRGTALLARGDTTGARQALEAAIGLKRVPTDTWWWLAEALTALGLVAEARPHLEKFVAKASKRAPFVDEARRRLSLGAEADPPEDRPN